MPEDHAPLRLADLPARVGSELGLSSWIAVDQERIDAFAECTLDRQWVHVDPARASSGPFGTTVAHGFLTLSLLSAAHFEVGAFPGDAGAILNYGLERVRFLAPVPAGSRVRVRVQLLEASEKGEDRLLLRLGNTVEIEGAERPALVAESLALLLR